MNMVKNNRIINGSEKSALRFIYICVYIFLSVLFLKLLYTHIIKSVFEQDLLWFIPTTARETEGLSYIKLISYVLSPWPTWFAMPPLKIYTFFILSLFGPLAKHFIFVSILFHFCCSILLFLVSKKLGLSSRISFLSSLMYLTLFAHFHTYIWPMAFQHLIVVFFILLGLNFYLKTDRLITNGGKYHIFYILTLLINLLASFCRLSILILPAMIITHILFCSKDSKERIKKYDIWLPLFASYLSYPLIAIIVGDPRIKGLLRPLNIFITGNPMPYMLISKFNLPIKFLILFLLGLSCLFIFRAMLVKYQKYNLRRVLKWALIIVLIIVMAVLIRLGGLKRLLIPYNIMVPFVGILATFLHPLQNVLLMDSVRPYYFIPLQLGVFNFLLSFLILVLFVKNFGFRHRQLVVLFTWYMGNMIYLYLWNPITSRYFIYLSPFFCIIFCAAFDYLYTYLANPTKLKIVSKEIILVLIFATLCIPNLLTIKLALFKGRLINTFLTYDYIRTANAIKGDLIKSDSITEIKRKGIYINNIIPITFASTGDFSASDPRNDNARFVFIQVFNDISLNVKSNQIPQKNENYITYSLSSDGYRINNSAGVNVSSFAQLFEAAQEQLSLNHYTEAIDLFREAIERKPFLFNYVLPKLGLGDLEWITGGIDMRTWINKIISSYSVGCRERELGRVKYISTIMNKETNEYIQCLFYISFLKYISGDAEESKGWFTKIRFLDSDYQRLYSWLAEVPLVKSDKRILSFLDSFDNASLYVAPENYTDRYKFEKFLLRLILNN